MINNLYFAYLLLEEFVENYDISDKDMYTYKLKSWQWCIKLPLLLKLMALYASMKDDSNWLRSLQKK